MYTTLRRDNDQIRQQIQERAVKAGQQICQQDMGEVRRCLATRQQLLENLVATVKQSEGTLRVVEQARAAKKMGG